MAIKLLVWFTARATADLRPALDRVRMQAAKDDVPEGFRISRNEGQSVGPLSRSFLVAATFMGCAAPPPLSTVPASALSSNSEPCQGMAFDADNPDPRCLVPYHPIANVPADALRLRLAQSPPPFAVDRRRSSSWKCRTLPVGCLRWRWTTHAGHSKPKPPTRRRRPSSRSVAVCAAEGRMPRFFGCFWSQTE